MLVVYVAVWYKECRQCGRRVAFWPGSADLWCFVLVREVLGGVRFWCVFIFRDVSGGVGFWLGGVGCWLVLGRHLLGDFVRCWIGVGRCVEMAVSFAASDEIGLVS